MDPLLDTTPPESFQGVSSFTDKLSNKMHKSDLCVRCLSQAGSLGLKDMVDFMDLLLSPASKVLNNWFESDVLKATLATYAVIGFTELIPTNVIKNSSVLLRTHITAHSNAATQIIRIQFQVQCILVLYTLVQREQKKKLSEIKTRVEDAETLVLFSCKPGQKWRE